MSTALKIFSGRKSPVYLSQSFVSSLEIHYYYYNECFIISLIHDCILMLLLLSLIIFLHVIIMYVSELLYY